MSLKDDLEAAQQEPTPPFEQWVGSLPKDDREALVMAAASDRISHRAFHDVVKAHGAKVGKETVTNWRKANGYVSR